MHLGVSFLDNWNPDLMKVSASTEDWFVGSFANWKSLINNDVNPGEVLEESNDVKTNLSEFLENWWVNTFR